MLYVLKKSEKIGQMKDKRRAGLNIQQIKRCTWPHQSIIRNILQMLVWWYSSQWFWTFCQNTWNYECIKYGQILVGHVHLDCMDVILKNEVSDPQCTVPALRTYMCQKKHTTEHYESLWVMEWPPRSSDLKINGAARDHFTDKDSQHPKRALECPSGSLDSYCWTLKETALTFA